MKNLGRLLTAMVTPFDEKGEVDYEQGRKLASALLDSGSTGLVVSGTTGESPTLSREEKLRLFAEVKSAISGWGTVIAGTGSYNTAESIELTKEAERTGVDACLLVVPYYNKPVQEGLYRHFSAIADAVDKPVVLYNVPGRTVADLLPETVGRLAEHENIVAIKEATGDIARLSEIRRVVSDDFRFFSGDDFTVLPFIEEGGHGVITVSGNVAPARMAQLCRLAAAGHHEEAKAIDDILQPLNTALFVESNPIPVKWAVHKMGLIEPGIRLPLTEFAAEYHEQMLAAMAGAGVVLPA